MANWKRHGSGAVMNSDITAYKTFRKQKSIIEQKDKEMAALKQRCDRLESALNKLLEEK